MCCSFWPIIFSKTITGTWEVNVDGRINHVLWYQNNVGLGTNSPSWISSQVFEVCVRQGLGGNPDWRSTVATPLEVNGITFAEVDAEIKHRKNGGSPRSHRTVSELLSSRAVLEEGQGNCLIIPLMGTWESIRLLNTHDVPRLLEDITLSLAIPSVNTGPLMAGSFGGGGGGGIIFLQFSIYDIVIAQNAAMLPSVLQQINPLKRPEINSKVFDTFEKWYQCPVAVCCFNNAESGQAKPLAFAFEPLYPHNIVVYTLDAHDGNAPDPNALVDLDHTVFVGSYLAPTRECAQVRYRDSIPEHLSPYMLTHVLGTTIKNRRMENGDIVFSTSDVRSGVFRGLRSLPPFAPHGAARLDHEVTRDAGYVRHGSGH